MLDKLKKQVQVEMEMLNQLLTDHMPLIIKCNTEKPDRIELSALAAMLHGFYNGIENIFKRIIIETGGEIPEGERWHIKLIDAINMPSDKRPPIISDELAESLKEYMEFRHFFRHAYPFQIKWELMEHLVKECPDILKQLNQDLEKSLINLEAFRG